jgi:hypothetical protein
MGLPFDKKAHCGCGAFDSKSRRLIQETMIVSPRLVRYRNVDVSQVKAFLFHTSFEFGASCQSAA